MTNGKEGKRKMNNSTEILLIADRSGSMSDSIEEMTNAINRIIDDQKKDTSPCKVSLWIFDDKVEKIWDRMNLSAVPKLTKETYCARGATALNDAIGMAMNDLGKSLAAEKMEDRPGKVMVVIVTDGFENASKEFSGQQIKDMIQHQKEKYSWQYMFLGADLDAYKMGFQYGLTAQSVANISKQNLQGAGSMVSRGLSRYRTAANIDGTYASLLDDEKEEAEK